MFMPRLCRAMAIIVCALASLLPVLVQGGRAGCEDGIAPSESESDPDCSGAVKVVPVTDETFDAFLNGGDGLWLVAFRDISQSRSQGFVQMFEAAVAHFWSLYGGEQHPDPGAPPRFATLNRATCPVFDATREPQFDIEVRFCRPGLGCGQVVDGEKMGKEYLLDWLYHERNRQQVVGAGAEAGKPPNEWQSWGEFRDKENNRAECC